MPTPKSEFLGGVRATLPLMVGVAPFGLIFGVLGTAAGLPPALVLAMSVIAFGGSAQIIAVGQMSATPAVPYPIMILTTFVVNLRHMLYSASMAPHVRPLAHRWKVLLAYLLTDEAYASTIGHYQQPGDTTHKHWFFLGSGLTLWSTWQLSTLLGVVVGAQLPASWGLDFTLALTFIGILLPVLRDRAVIVAAGAAGLAAVLAHGLPLQLGLIVAAVVGITAGMLVEALTGQKPATADAAPGGQ